MEKQKITNFRGMMPIMPTAIDEKGSLDEESQRRIVRYCMNAGAAAIGHFGFASEFFKIADADRTRLIEVIVDEVGGRLPVFIGVTATSHRGAGRYSEEAERLGADMVMAALPYVRIPRKDEIHDYFRSISESTSLPIIIQDTPQSSALLDVGTLMSLAASFTSIVSVKAEGSDFISKSADLIRTAGDRLQVIGGAGGKHLIHLLRIGVTAFMTGTEALELHGGAVRAYLDGEPEKAAKIYFERILPYLMFYSDHSDELLKQMLHSRGIISNKKVLPPEGLVPMGKVEQQEFVWVLSRIGLSADQSV